MPLSFASKSQTNSTISSTFGSIWLAPKDKDIVKIDSDPQDWIICDIDKVGYYRVNYDSRNWYMLIEHLRTDEFHTIKPISRATLIDDAFNLAEGGYIPFDIFFNLIDYLSKETEYEPWFTSLEAFNFLNQIFKDLPVLRTAIQVIKVSQYCLSLSIDPSCTWRKMSLRNVRIAHLAREAKR